MTEFTTEATLEVVVDQQSLTNAEQTIQESIGGGTGGSTGGGVTSVAAGSGDDALAGSTTMAGSGDLVDILGEQLDVQTEILDEVSGPGGSGLTSVGGGGLLPELGVSGSLLLSASKVLAVSGVLALAATAVLTVTGTVDMNVGDILVTTGVLTLGIASIVTVAGVLTLSAPAVLAVTGVVALTAAGVLAVSGVIGLRTPDILSVSGVLTIAAAGALAITGVVSLPAAAVIAVTGAVVLTAGELIELVPEDRTIFRSRGEDDPPPESRPASDTGLFDTVRDSLEASLASTTGIQVGGNDGSDTTETTINRDAIRERARNKFTEITERPTPQQSRQGVGDGTSDIEVNAPITINQTQSFDSLERELDRRLRQLKNEILAELQQKETVDNLSRRQGKTFAKKNF